jgi:Sulfotransferase family
VAGRPRRWQPRALRLSLGALLRKAPRALWARSLRAGNGALAAVETWVADGSTAPLRHAPLFVVGAPRSGSTLLYQALVQHFSVGYLSNLHCRVYGAPSLVERVWSPGEPAGGYSSHLGRTRGAAAPSECGEYWYRFFRRKPQYVPLAEADPRRLRALRASVRALGNAAGGPLVFKNLICSLRLQPIGTALPEAVFVFIRRDLVENADSLLEARKRLHGDYRRWWSAEPPEIEELRSLPAEQQVVEQVRRIEAVIERDRDRLGPDRFLDVRYESLCDAPRETMDAVAHFGAEHGLVLRRRHDLPAKFQRSAETRIDPDLYARLVDYVRST